MEVDGEGRNEMGVVTAVRSEIDVLKVGYEELKLKRQYERGKAEGGGVWVEGGDVRGEGLRDGRKAERASDVG